MLVCCAEEASEILREEDSLGILEGWTCGDVPDVSKKTAAFLSKEDEIEKSSSTKIDFISCNRVSVWNVDVILDDDVDKGEVEDTSPNVSWRVSHPAP